MLGCYCRDFRVAAADQCAHPSPLVARAASGKIFLRCARCNAQAVLDGLAAPAEAMP